MSAIVTCPNCGKKNRLPAAASGYPRCGVCKSAVPWIVDAGDADFAEVVEKAPQVVLVDLSTRCFSFAGRAESKQGRPFPDAERRNTRPCKTGVHPAFWS